MGISSIGLVRVSQFLVFCFQFYRYTICFDFDSVQINGSNNKIKNWLIS